MADYYECSVCGEQFDWKKDTDDGNGIWGCEKCYEPFCKKCFVKKFGIKAWMHMVNQEDLIKCPNCYSIEEE